MPRLCVEFQVPSMLIQDPFSKDAFRRLEYPVVANLSSVLFSPAFFTHSEAEIDELAPVHGSLAPGASRLTPIEINSPVIFTSPPPVSKLPPVDSGCSPVYPYLFICHLQLLPVHRLSIKIWSRRGGRRPWTGVPGSAFHVPANNCLDTISNIHFPIH